MGAARHMLGLRKHLRTSDIRNIMEYRFHERAVESSTGIERWNHDPGNHKRTESRRSRIRGIELVRSVYIAMDTVNRLALAPALKGGIELSNRRSDRPLLPVLYADGLKLRRL